MAELLIHIGAPKTGSTSIQQFLQSNQGRLRIEFGVHNPKFFRMSRARRLHTYALGEEAAPRSLQLLDFTKDDISEFLHTYRKDAEAALEADRDAVRWVVSNELLFNLEERHVRRIHDLVARHFEKMRILLYIRRQDIRSVSAYVQSIKRDYEFASPFQYAAAGYRRPIEAWSSVFGDRSIMVRLYESSELPDGDVVKDFLVVNGLAWGEGWKMVPRENGSWGPTQVHLARVFNRHFPYLDESLSRPRQLELRQEALRFLYSLPVRQGLPASKDEARRFYAGFAEENEWIRSRFFPERDRLFSESFDMYQDTEVLASPPDLDEAFAHLWRYHQDRMSEIKSELAISRKTNRKLQRGLQKQKQVLAERTRERSLIGRLIGNVLRFAS